MQKNNYTEFVTRCRAHIAKTGYLSLGEFFENVSDSELKVILELLYEGTNSTNEKTMLDAQNAVNFVMSIVQAGIGLRNVDLKQHKQHLLNFSLYVLQEVSDRQLLCDKVLREKRIKYSIEVEPA